MIKNVIVLFVLLNVFFLQESASRQVRSIDEMHKLSGPERYLFVWDSLMRTNNAVFGTRIEDWLAPTERCFKLAQSSGDSILSFKMKYPMATVYHTLARFEECIPLFLAILKLEESLPDRWLFNSYLKLEEAYRRLGNLKDAIPIRQKRIALGHASNFWEIYADAQLYGEAINDFRSTETMPKQGWVRMYKYIELANLFFKDESLDSAEYYYELAYQDGKFISERTDYDGVGVYSENNKYYWTTYCRGMKGRIMVKRGLYDQAIPLLRADIAMSKTVGEVDATLPKRLDMAECYIEFGDYDEARAYIDTVKYFNEGRGWVDTKLQLLEVESDYYFKTQDFTKAAFFLQAYNVLYDSIIKIRAKNNLIAMTTILDLDKQKAQVAEQKFELEKIRTEQILRRNQRNLLIAGIVVLASILMVFYVRYKHKMKAKARAERDSAIISKQAEKLKELDQVKTRFFSNISHEFRTPLTLIQGPLTSLSRHQKMEPEKIEANLTIANRNVGVLRTLIDELLEFNKLDAGDIQFDAVSVFVKDYIEELTLGYESLAEEKGIIWKTHFPFRDDLRLDLPVSQLERILNNLISNAVKHTPHGGTVQFELHFEDGVLKATVTDSGTGISSTDLPLIFERFYQSAHGQSMAHSSGIGLAYVKEIAEVLGGSISVESKLGLGSTFVFTLATKESTGPIAVKHSKDEDGFVEHLAYNHPNNKILLVEDNKEMADYIKQILGDNIFIIEWVENGRAALQKLEEFDADLIITDIMMPVMDGLELLAKLKAHQTFKYKSIIMLTAKSSQETQLDALSFGLDDYLTKPFNPIELSFRIKNLLKNQFERTEWLKNEKSVSESVESPLITDLIQEIERNITNKQFGVLNLANLISLSDRQLTRVVKKAIGLTPASLIREVKLNRAKIYLESKTYRSVAETCYAVGFEKPSYFSKVFFERYGKKPSSYFG